MPFLVLLLACIAALSGCSKHLTKEENCQARWDKLHGKYEKGKYNEARDLYKDMVAACQGSPFSEQAAFELGEIQYKLGDYMEAESEYAGFLKDYPASRRFRELATYRLAMSEAKQVGIPQRDQSKTIEALGEFDRFLDEYPDSKYADTAKQEVEKLMGKLVSKQLQIARLYERMHEPQAAAIYYKHILKEYPGRADLRDINLKLARCYVRMHQFDEAEAFLAKFDGIAADDPFKDKVKDVYEELEKTRNRVAKQKKEEQEQSKRQEPM
jgi:outer membrane assembly lipoprotein YfiO